MLRWLNHSDDPNAEFDGFELYARRTIAVGSEITIDYGAGSS
nr:SET domain-containing protein [Allochromatium vinosum]